jgi:hypothetical protein
MSTVHVVNSSFIFLSLIIDEIKILAPLSMIQEITNTDSLKIIWDNSMKTDYTKANHEWKSFKLTFGKPVDLSPLFQQYPSSIIPVTGLAKIPGENIVPTEVKRVENKTHKKHQLAVIPEVHEEPEVVTKPVKHLNKKQGEELRKFSFAKAPNGLNSSDPYSGIGQPYQNNSGYQLNYIDPGPPAEYKQARGTSANLAVKEARKEIDARRSSIVAKGGKRHMK